MNRLTSLARDPLLAIAKVILWVLIGAMGVAVAATLFAAPALLIAKPYLYPHIHGDLPAAVMPTFLNALAGACLLVAVLLIMVCVTLYLLKKIVDTVGEGDPFVPENARRLTQMAWLTLGIQLSTLPIVALSAQIAGMVNDATSHADVTVVGGISGNGLLLMLILFILARVFRKGAEMRAELEGTV